MLAECSGVGIDIDVDAIVPPPGVALPRWLNSFPSFGFLLATEQDKAEELLSVFRSRDLHAAVIGEVRRGLRSHARIGWAPGASAGLAAREAFGPRAPAFAESVA